MHLVVPTTQLWTLVIGALVPLATYVINHVAPWTSEPVKSFVLLIASAASAALYTALSTNVIGFNTPTLQLLLTGIVGALAAHHMLWRPSTISTRLGGGSNAQAHGHFGWIRPAPAPAPAEPPPAA